ncbi:MAG: phytanoyl-CoA dioxygenase family protein [Candidatus Latescibacterota bacterium]|jgi:ectoine hydroxylase-related dioxygenase (phytanoyl-CoA dioxygenase family)
MTKNTNGRARSCIVPFIDQSEYLSALLGDGRIDGILSSLLGDDYQYLGSDGNYYVGDTGWHSDGGWPRPIVYYKMAFYLDSLTRDTGALRVIPGSHRYGEGYAEEIERQIKQ